MAEQPEPLTAPELNLLPDEDIQELASRQFEQICEIYRIQPKLMIEHYELEQRTTLTYDGRQLLELIQNADDAAHSVTKPKMLITLTGNQLIVANTGELFSNGGLDSIFHSHMSPKFMEKNQIGNKGLGFRSILNWSECVRIKSGNLKIGFSEKFSQNVLADLLKEPAVRAAILGRFKRMVPAIAVLRAPEIYDQIDLPAKYDAFDTIIVLDLKPGVAELISKQLEKTINPEMMLFLNHLEEVRVETPAFDQTYGREVVSDISLANHKFTKDIALNFRRDGKPDRQIWHLYGKSGKINDKSFELAVAWQDMIQENSNLLHCFFRTDVTFRFPGLLHGTFELSDNRNELIPGDGYNALLFSEAAELIAGAAGVAAEKKSGAINYLPMRLGQVEGASLTGLIKASGFEAKLKAELLKQKVFPCTRKQYICWQPLPGYYQEPEFSAYLPPDEYRGLLLPCEEPSDRFFIESLVPGKYELSMVIRSLAENRKQIPTEAYARLVLAVQRYLSESALTEHFLYDENYELLDPLLPVFFPGSGKQYKLPSGVGVQLLDTALAEALKKEAGTAVNAVLIATLSRFNLKEFSFPDVVDALIGHYKLNTNPVVKLAELHRDIFSFYRNEAEPPAAWKGRPVPMLNRKNKVGFANSLYFGKEYNNLVGESLFHYDPSKIIAAAVKFGQDDTSVWRAYLAWTGVASLPRRKMVLVDGTFGFYVMRNFDYKKPTGGRSFADFQQFAGQLNHFDEIKALSVDQLENLLKNNTPETILAWLNADDVLMGHISKNTESSQSEIWLTYAYGKDSKHIAGTLMPSYLRWKLSQTPWLTTESSRLECPDRCTTAASITGEFSPLIEKPKLDIEILRKRGIDRSRADDLLYACGVHRSVNTFSTGMIYGMLLNLPGIADSGKMAKSIYNQLAQNFDDRSVERLDKNDPAHQKFFKEGKVYCSHGAYEPIDQVFYVNDKHLGESVIRQFNTITVDRRRGKPKVQKLFGAAPLENVDISLSCEPVPHPAAGPFEQDIIQFKPFVYVLRQSADSGTERLSIKKAKFRLVSELQVKLVKDAVVHELSFNDYEFLYLEDHHMVYLKAPEAIIDLPSLKEEFNFYAAVAEAFSAIIDVDAQRQQIRELYCSSPNGREAFLRSELEDPSLSKLTAARTALDIINDAKGQFWRAFAACLKRKSFKANLANDYVLLVELCRMFPKYQEAITSAFPGIDYENCNEETTCGLICELFKTTGISLSQFNGFFFPAISIAALYTQAFRQQRDFARQATRESYFLKCVAVPALRKSFTQQIKRYEELIAPVVETVDFDVNDALNKAIETLFGELPPAEPAGITADQHYYANKEQLVLLAAGKEIGKPLLDSFLNESPPASSLLFFEQELNTVLQLLADWTAVGAGGDKSSPMGGKTRRIQFGNKALFYEDLLDLKNQLDTQLPDLAIHKLKLKDIELNKVNIASRETGSGKPFRTGGRSNVQNDEIGFLGEYLVYQFLLATVNNKASIKWISRYAKDCHVSTEDGTGAGYDIEYIPNGNKYPRYVEVKVVGHEDAFHISSTEVRFGEQFKKSHDIFLVRSLHDPINLQIERIDGLFDYDSNTSFNNNDRFTVVNDNYILIYKRSGKSFPQ
jgi:hypothetical protein